MKKVAIIFLLLLSTACRAETNTVAQFANPIDVLVADPFVYHENDTYYLYGTSAPDGFRVYTSKDLVNWRYRGFAYRTSKASWPDSAFWAPEVYKKGDEYFMFYCARGLNKKADGYTMRICVAKSKSPLGPFKDVKSPAFVLDKAVIDPNVFVDDDGTAYLFYVLDCSENSISEIWVGKLNDKWTDFDGKPVKCFGPSQLWEGEIWNEAPFALKHGKFYYLMYSANYFASPNYSVGYAVATNIFGPWKKYEKNPILKLTEKVWGPGHHCVTKSPDGKETFIVYHTQQTYGSGARQVAIDRLVFEKSKNREADIIKIFGPTVEPQKYPSGALPFPIAKSDDFSAAELDRSHWLVFNENPRAFKIKNGKLIITTLDGDIHRERADINNLFLQYAPEGDFEIETKFEFTPKENYEQVFLCVWQDHNNYLRLSYVYDGAPKVEVAKEVKGNYKSYNLPVKKKIKFLKIKKTGEHYDFYYSFDNKIWKKVGKGFNLKFNDIKVGISAISPVSERTPVAEFDWFNIK